MASLLDDKIKDGLVEAFPFSPNELDMVLDLYSSYKQHENGNFSVYQWLLRGSTKERTDLLLIQRVENEILPPKLVSSLLQQALETVFVLGSSHGDDESLNEIRTFCEATATLVGRRGPKSILSLLNPPPAAAVAAATDTKDVLKNIHCITIASQVLFTGEFPDALSSSSTSALLKTTPSSWKVPADESFVDWATNTFPGASTALSTFFHVLFFTRQHDFRPDIPPLELPRTDLPSALFQHWWNHVPMSMALLCPNRLGGDWKRLYSSDENGFSFRAMQEALLNFNGPTVIILETTKNSDILGFQTDCPYKSSRKWFGCEYDSFLFTLHPTLAFYPYTGQGSRCQYLQLPSTRHAQDLRGLAVGGVADDRPRLLLTESLQDCRACEFDVAYAPGPLLSDPMEAYFDVQVLEVWATHVNPTSFQEAKKGGSLARGIREATREKVARVDKSQFVNDFSSGAYMNKAFQHREMVGDRHSFTVKEFREEMLQSKDLQHVLQEMQDEDDNDDEQE